MAAISDRKMFYPEFQAAPLHPIAFDRGDPAPPAHRTKPTAKHSLLMKHRKLLLALLILLLYVLHQDFWNWTTAHPLVAGFLSHRAFLSCMLQSGGGPPDGPTREI